MLPAELVHTTMSAAAAAARAVALFDIPRPGRARLVKRGLNDVYEVGSFFLRIARADRRREAEVEAEAQVLAELKRRGAPVAVAVRGHNGRFCQRLAAPEGERAMLLFTRAVGALAEHSPRDAHALGSALGKMHAAQRPPIQLPHMRRLDAALFFDHFVLIVLSQLADQRDLAATLGQVAEDLQARLALFGDTLSVGFCHGDCHGHNAAIDQGIATLFDFDEGGIGWLAYDLAVYLSTCRRLAPGWGPYLWSHFFAGYRTQHALRPADIESLETMVLLRQLWGLGISAEGVPIWGDQAFRARVAYDIRALAEGVARLSGADLLSTTG